MDKIMGCIPYRNNNERKKLFKALKKEFQGNVEIMVQNNFMYYTSLVERTFI
jgi:hypothetical protein